MYKLPTTIPFTRADGSAIPRIFCRGGRTGQKIHRASAGSSVLDCGIWLKADVGHFALKPADVQRANAARLCERCFGASEIAAASSPEEG
jgi:hypothetical protein